MILVPFCSRFLVALVLAASLLFIQGCSSLAVERSEHFDLKPLIVKSKENKEGAEGRQVQAPSGETEVKQKKGNSGKVTLTAEAGPQAPFDATRPGEFPGSSLQVNLSGQPIELSVNNLPLPVFINEVFGEKLGLSYSLSPAISELTDLVTLRLNEPRPPQELFRAARSVLADYGVALEKKEGVWHFSLSEQVSDDQTPLLITGEALPDVPVSHRPVYQVVPLKVAKSTQMKVLLDGLFEKRKLMVSTSYSTGNSLILRGSAEDVRNAYHAIQYFDKPLIRGKHSMLLRPAFQDVGTLAAGLNDLLQAQGYAVGGPTSAGVGVVLAPMAELGIIVAFAMDEKTLEHIKSWAVKLDQSHQTSIENGMFVYEVQNTSADNLAELITKLYGGDTQATDESSENQAQAQRTRTSGANNERNDQQPGVRGSVVADGRLVVDERRNVLVYRGSGSNWMELRSVIDQLDKQVPSVLMEVLLAEVTLNDGQGLGVEWFAKNGIDDLDGTLSTLGGLGIGSRGFTYTLNKAGQTRAVINAFYDSNQAVIRSSPKIMVKSGEVARIEVGNEIPILTSTRQGEFQTGGDTDVLQQFEFRQTGVNLTVEPIVQASGLVDIKINQTLSETQDTGSGDTFLPTILNRSVETSLTLRDGGSVVLGGLISRSTSQGEQGVPLLGRIPILGRAFSTRSDNSSTTELLIMVVPYVVKNDEEAQQVSEQLRKRIQEERE